MITQNRFDPVFDCQQVFKALMNAMARPGTVQSIAPQAGHLEGERAPLLAAGLTLLDNWRKFYVDSDPELAQTLRELTYGVPAPLEEADYLFLVRPCAPEACEAALGAAKAGTLAEPDRSATFFVLLDALTGGPAMTLTGPGVDGAIQIHLPEAGSQWIRIRERMGFEFPCGIELCFVTPGGELMAVPRKVKIGGDR